MRGLLVMGIPYQHAREVSIVRTDTCTSTTNDVTTDPGTTARRTQTYVWSTFNSPTPTLVSTVESSVDGLQTWQTQYRDANTPVTSQSQTVYGANGTRTITTTAPDNSYTISAYSNGRLTSVTRFDSGENQISSVSYGYDPHGRQNTLTDARNGTTTLGFNAADLVTSVTTPNPGTLGGTPQTTATYYNNMLQATNVLQPDGTSVTSEYYLTGELKRQYGSRTYPVGYGYDYAGRMNMMTNWSGFASGAGARVTAWNYDQYRGWLASKTYDGGAAGPSYAYTAAGRLQTRAWARGITTTYGYNWASALASVSYSDSTPAVTTAYDRLGRVASTIRNGMTSTMAYNTANELLSESYSGGTLANLSVTNGFDQYLRRAQLAALNYASPFLQHSFGFDNASRLQTVTDNTASPAYSATYTYLANSPLVNQITFKQSTTTQMTTTKQYDYLNRLSSISSAIGSTAIGDSYAYNNANQRIHSTLSDGSYWLYTYDSLGQVVAGNKYWTDGTPVAGQQFDYTFDTIGNRTATLAGGDQNGSNLRSASYGANTLNQYTNRTVPGAVDVMGLGFATNAVTVNGQAAYRKGEYFRQQLTVNNGSTPVWQSVTNAAAGQNSVTGALFVAKTPEQFTYDLDGNLTTDGRWTYGWDAENRLVTLTTNTAVGPQQSLKFEYDWKGRRIRKQVWPNANWNGSPTNDVKFIYDGWNLVGILNSSFSLQTSFMWGLDLSGSPQAAGGVGGLLEVVYKASQTTNCFVAFDGNGNVTALADTGSSNILARYEYGPFGEVIRATGPMAKANPFRFSTKYQDDEADLFYYGYRYYNASTGRWLSRDPLAEGSGSLNLFSMLDNDAVDDIDPLGLQRFEFVIIKNAGGKHGGNLSGDWGSPGDYFSGSATVTSSSATTVVTGRGPVRTHCCNTVISGDKREAEAGNNNAGSILVYMTDAPKGTYSVTMSFSGSASITLNEEDATAATAGAVLAFYTGLRNVLDGSVSYKSPSRTGRSPLSWGPKSEEASSTVVIKRKSDRVEVGRYDLTMQLNKCGDISITATGRVSVTGHSKIK